MDDLPLFYRLTPPGGQTFFAALYAEGDNLYTYTTRTGKWALEPEFMPDLIMPEQTLDDWDFEEVTLDDVPTPPWEVGKRVLTIELED